MVPTFSDMFVHAAMCGGLVSLGTLAIFLLPWRDEELAETTQAFREGWRLLDRALRSETDALAENPPTIAAWQPSSSQSKAA
jgi:hypothetical protein